MSQTVTISTKPSTSYQSAGSSRSARIAILGYGLAAYSIGVAGLVALILATLGILPFTGGPVTLESVGARIAFNLALIALFGVHHAVTARDWFKERLTRVLPAAMERSTFTLLAGVIMGAIIWLWQPLPNVSWSVEHDVARLALIGGCAFGWCYLLAATFAIDHFELFGVKQVWRNLRGLQTPAPKFTERLMYRFDRHPIMTGVALGLWCTPVLTVERLILAAGFSVYIVLGVAIEERDLIRKHGEGYLSYARRVRTIVPGLRRR